MYIRENFHRQVDWSMRKVFHSRFAHLDARGCGGKPSPEQIYSNDAKYKKCRRIHQRRNMLTASFLLSIHHPAFKHPSKHPSFLAHRTSALTASDRQLYYNMSSAAHGAASDMGALRMNPADQRSKVR